MCKEIIELKQFQSHCQKRLISQEQIVEIASVVE